MLNLSSNNLLKSQLMMVTFYFLGNEAAQGIKSHNLLPAQCQNSNVMDDNNKNYQRIKCLQFYMF
jgi:hypothetical protein